MSSCTPSPAGSIGAPRPDGVVFETKSGPIVVMARAIVDATGDGDVAALAGAPVRDRPRG